jgi:cytidylate kinase
MIIAIDGPAGSGKSTVARELAKRLHFRYIETGSMYRAVAWKAEQLGIDTTDRERVAEVARNLKIEFVPDGDGQRILVDGEDLTGRLKTERIGKLAATVAANPDVRDVLVPKQQAMGQSGDVVMDGRDIGTVVFPGADRKFYLDAEVNERARRRFDEMREKHPEITLEEIIDQVQKRDYEDKNRAVSPLRVAEDAVEVDTTSKTIAGVIEEMMRFIQPASNV